MPKVVVTGSKGLVQSSGAGFSYLDFLAGYQGNLSGTAAAITEAESIAARLAATPAAGLIALATLTTNALNTCDFDGQTNPAAIYLPAATAGAHVAVKFTNNGAGTNALDIVASGTYESAEEAARQAAGGTAAVFAAGYVVNDSKLSTLSDGADTKLQLTLHGTNTSVAADSFLHFLCVEDGEWLVARFGPLHGTGAAMTFS